MQSTETQAFVTEAQRTDATRPPRVRIIDNANMRDADTEMPMRYGHCVSDRVEMRAVLGLFALFYCVDYFSESIMFSMWYFLGFLSFGAL